MKIDKIRGSVGQFVDALGKQADRFSAGGIDIEAGRIIQGCLRASTPDLPVIYQHREHDWMRELPGFHRVVDAA